MESQIGYKEFFMWKAGEKQIPFKIGDKVHVNPTPIKYCFPVQYHKETDGIVLEIVKDENNYKYVLGINQRGNIYPEFWYEHECLSLRVELPEIHKVILQALAMIRGFDTSWKEENAYFMADFTIEKMWKLQAKKSVLESMLRMLEK